MRDTNSTGAIRVWDPFVRVFHWTLVACVLGNYFLINDGEDLHQALGYLACALVTARVVWGFIGSKHARFADFFPTPQRLKTHLSRLLSGESDPHPGHNPLGAVMMLTLLMLVIALGVTGYLQGTDRFWGEEWLQELHELIASLLIAFAAVHVLAAIVMSRIERTNLVRAMITGIKVRH